MASAEAILAEIWSELLDIPPPGRDEDFFALGGHSLLAMRLIARLRERLKVDLPLIAIFEHPTIRGLAPVVEALPVLKEEAPIASRRRSPGNGD